jgi:hypothetical protein
MFHEKNMPSTGKLMLGIIGRIAGGVTAARLAAALTLAPICNFALAQYALAGETDRLSFPIQASPSCAPGTAASLDIRIDEHESEITLSAGYKTGEVRLRGPKPVASSPPAGAALALDVVRVREKVFINEQLPIVCQMLLRYLQMGGGGLPSRFNMGFYDEMKPRLVAAAAESPDWDRKAGRPRNGLINDSVVKLMNEQKVYRELDKLFADLGPTRYRQEGKDPIDLGQWATASGARSRCR